MSAITQNLPWFIKDLGVAVVGKKCYVSLVENLNLGDVDCIKYAISKGLGLGIVVGGSVMKVPQMLLILNAGSAEGLSLPAYALETLSYAITLAYSVKNNFPFSTYGENLFLTIQDVIITLLIIAYAPAPAQTKSKSPPPASNKPFNLSLALLGTAATAYTLSSLPLSTLSLVQFTTLPLSLFSKLPQIVQNARAESTGQLSAVAVIAQVLGCIARLFTTATEVKDPLVLAGFAVALVLNAVLGAQMAMYWGKEGKKAPVSVPVKEKREDEGEEIVSPQVRADLKAEGKTSAYEALQQPHQPVHRFATPPPRSFSPAGGQRKWARQTVD
ncbi:mannose-P-dolichol utilization defect 1 protein [Macrolepiota fuliginosa MF-IS2]|uniref:Mannose-P-dolichol utilization defect 1 protein n=1 Tax=Macrolepiota fuliginosa MF-IS2 TaxID=1400762 RepID=A0A9P5XL54_9AGAR|nr:mannose-P-dolichol utilization defect 1 protein [Macrolepiota fuliginosa MF-IS2]